LLENKTDSVNLTLLVALLGVSTASAATYYSRATGNWNSTTTWSTTSYTGAAATATPVAGDTVNIGGGFTVTVTVNAACAAVNFQSAAASPATLSINSGITLSVSGAITIPRAGGSGTTDQNTLAVGAGTLNAGSVAFTGGGTSDRHQITISTGTVTVSGDVTTDNNGASATIAFTGAGLSMQVSDYDYHNLWCTLTTFAGCTVNYNGAAQTVKGVKLSG